MQEAVGIVERSDAVAEDVIMLRNAVVRYLRAALPDETEKVRSSLQGRRKLRRVPVKYRSVTDDGGDP